MSTYRFELTEKQMETIAIAIIQRKDKDGKHLMSPSWFDKAIEDFIKNGQCSITFERIEDL